MTHSDLALHSRDDMLTETEVTLRRRSAGVVNRFKGEIHLSMIKRKRGDSPEGALADFISRKVYRGGLGLKNREFRLMMRQTVRDMVARNEIYLNGNTWELCPQLRLAASTGRSVKKTGSSDFRGNKKSSFVHDARRRSHNGHTVAAPAH